MLMNKSVTLSEKVSLEDLLKDLYIDEMVEAIDEMVEAWCFGCCQAHWGLPVGFLLLRYSVLYTVEPLSLLYLL